MCQARSRGQRTAVVSVASALLLTGPCWQAHGELSDEAGWRPLFKWSQMTVRPPPPALLLMSLPPRHVLWPFLRFHAAAVTVSGAAAVFTTRHQCHFLRYFCCDALLHTAASLGVLTARDPSCGRGP